MSQESVEVVEMDPLEQEMKAMRTIARALSGLSNAARERVINHVAAMEADRKGPHPPLTSRQSHLFEERA